MAEAIRLLLVDDHAVVRAGYRRLLETCPEFSVVGEAGSAREALEQQRQQVPDVVILDLGLPDIGGVELIGRLLQRDATLRILMFSLHRQPAHAAQALRAGALGYVTKSSPPAVLLEAVAQVAVRRRYISPDLAPQLAFALLESPAETLAALSPREFEVLRLLLEGHEAQDIGQRLSISAKTVRNCHYQIKDKLGARNDIELVRAALQLGLMSDSGSVD